jgi:hypothetical protein
MIIAQMKESQITNYRNLRDGDVHITSGFTKRPRKGHAWIWDGIYCVANSNNVSKLYALHCNWGWGGYCDGWYYNNLHETPNNGSGKPYLDDNVQLYFSMY